MTNGKSTTHPVFTRKIGEVEKKTSRLRRLNGESPVAFFARLNALGYDNGTLDKSTAHWNGDHNEYHAGKTESCRPCLKARTKDAKSVVGQVRTETPVKIGKLKPGSGGLSMLPLYFATSFVETIGKLPLSALRLVVSVPSQVSHAEEKEKAVNDKVATSPEIAKLPDSKDKEVPSAEKPTPALIEEAKALDVRIDQSEAAIKEDVKDHAQILGSSVASNPPVVAEPKGDEKRQKKAKGRKKDKVQQE